MDGDKIEAVQAVVDRVNAYQESSPDRDVRRELQDGLDEAGVTLDDEQLLRLAGAVERADGPVSAREIL